MRKLYFHFIARASLLNGNGELESGAQGVLSGVLQTGCLHIAGVQWEISFPETPLQEADEHKLFSLTIYTLGGRKKTPKNGFGCVHVRCRKENFLVRAGEVPLQQWLCWSRFRTLQTWGEHSSCLCLKGGR